MPRTALRTPLDFILVKEPGVLIYRANMSFESKVDNIKALRQIHTILVGNSRVASLEVESNSNINTIRGYMLSIPAAFWAPLKQCTFIVYIQAFSYQVTEFALIKFSINNASLAIVPFWVLGDRDVYREDKVEYNSIFFNRSILPLYIRLN